MTKGWLVAVIAALLAACTVAPPPRPAVEAPAPADFPTEFYRQAAARGAPVYRVDSADSLVVIEVRRAGSLAPLGHDHVIASHDVAGFAAPDAGRADLWVPLDRLAVDEPKLRAEAGFDGEPDAAAIDGTRANMLAKLHADVHPHARIAVARRADGTLDVTLTVNGITRTLAAPATVAVDGDRMTVEGRLALAQTDFDVAPYSILGGALAVADRVEVRFAIRGRRATP